MATISSKVGIRFYLVIEKDLEILKKRFLSLKGQCAYRKLSLMHHFILILRQALEYRCNQEVLCSNEC